MELVGRGISEQNDFEKWHTQGVFREDNNNNAESYLDDNKAPISLLQRDLFWV